MRGVWCSLSSACEGFVVDLSKRGGDVGQLRSDREQEGEATYHCDELQDDAMNGQRAIGYLCQLSVVRSC